MAKKVETKEVKTIEVKPVLRGQVDFHILGRTPLICNRVSEKAKRELLYPKKGRLTGTLKHSPEVEFRASPYVDDNPKSATYLKILAAAFKGAITAAAIDIPESSKSQVGRLLWVEGERLDLYGIPKLLMSIVRCADINRTPDIRTRVILPEWCCKITITFVQPWLNETSVSNLLAFAGLTQGIFDWRQGKGKGNYGQFEITGPDDPRYRQLFKTAGRKAQVVAMSTPDFYDDESESLYGWFHEELKRRGDEPMTSKKTSGARRATAERGEAAGIAVAEADE